MGDVSLLLMKFDSSGNIEWAKPFGGADTDVGESIKQTNDGGYIVTGYTKSFGAGDYDLLLAKFGSNGNIQWTKSVGGLSSDFGLSIQQTNDEGYIVTGVTESGGFQSADLLLVKFNSNGDVQWAKGVRGQLGCCGKTYNVYGKSVRQTSDGGYIVTGTVVGGDAWAENLLLMKLDSNSNVEWIRGLEITQNPGIGRKEFGESVIETSDGYIVAGSALAPIQGPGSTYYNFLLVKFKLNGDFEWQTIVGKDIPDSYYDDTFGFSVEQTSDGGYVMGGESQSFDYGNRYDIFLVKFNSNGNVQWAKVIGRQNFIEYFKSFQITNDEGYAVLGEIYAKTMYLAKLNPTGDIPNCNQITSIPVSSLNISFPSPPYIFIPLVTVYDPLSQAFNPPLTQNTGSFSEISFTWTPPFNESYLCQECPNDITMKCATVKNPPGETKPEIKSCTEDGTNSCCPQNTDCVSGGTCYNQGNTKTIQGKNLVCSSGTWCPVGFKFDENLGVCVYKPPEKCYDPNDPKYCPWRNDKYKKDPQWWTDKRCINPQEKRCCCPDAEWQGMVYYKKDYIVVY